METSSNQRIVVLGTAGFIGFHLSRKLQELNNANLVLIDNFIRSSNDSEFKLLLLKPNIQFFDKDLSDPGAYIDFFQVGDIVINCTAFNGTRNFYERPVDVVRHSAITSILSAEFAAKAAVAKYLYFGSAESYSGSINLGLANVPTAESVPLVIDDPLNVRWSYAASKTMGEIATVANVHQHGLNAKIFRVHNIYGPRMGLDHAVPDLVSIIVNFIYDHTADKNLIYHIGSTKETKIKDLADLILNLLGIEQNIIPLPNLVGSVMRRIPDTSLLKSRFSFTETDLKAGIRHYIEWFQNKR